MDRQAPAFNLPRILGGGTKKKTQTRPSEPAKPELPPTNIQWIPDPITICRALSKSEGKDAMEKMYQFLIKGKKPVGAGAVPHLVMAIGPPGAGKSTLGREMVAALNPDEASNYVEFDTDAIIDFHPRAAEIASIPDMQGAPTGVGYAYGWYNCNPDFAMPIFGRLFEERYNIILQAHDFHYLIVGQQSGYMASLLYIAVTEETAVQRAVKRAYQMGRFIANPFNEAVRDFIRSRQAAYRSLAPWYALWADNLIVVANEEEGKFPQPSEYRVYLTHPALPTDVDWRSPVVAFQKAIDDLHNELDVAAKKKK